MSANDHGHPTCMSVTKGNTHGHSYSLPRILRYLKLSFGFIHVQAMIESQVCDIPSDLGMSQVEENTWRHPHCPLSAMSLES